MVTALLTALGALYGRPARSCYREPPRHLPSMETAQNQRRWEV